MLCALTAALVAAGTRPSAVPPGGSRPRAGAAGAGPGGAWGSSAGERPSSAPRSTLGEHDAAVPVSVSAALSAASGLLMRQTVLFIFGCTGWLVLNK